MVFLSEHYEINVSVEIILIEISHRQYWKNEK